MDRQRHYYNEIDPFAAEWLQNLMDAGEIPAGDVDTRSIKDVQPDDLDGYIQCHFFAGIGGWPLALRLAGWPDDVPIWTGSCPCQPFSQSGRKRGKADPRHLWPDWFRLIKARKPATTTGEQVASKDGREWLAGVRTDMEGMGHDFGAADLCAPWVKAPHLRQRLYWLADSGGTGREVALQHRRNCDASPGKRQANGAGGNCDSLGMANAKLQREGRRGSGVEGQAGGRRDRPAIDSASCRVVDGQQPGLEGFGQDVHDRNQPGWLDADQDGPVAETGDWLPFRVAYCRDGKYRRVPVPESGIQPVAYGIPRNVGRVLAGVAGVASAASRARPNRKGRLKGYGNAIVPQVAAEFIRAYMECG